MGICTDPDILNIIRIGKLLITLLEVGIIVALIIYAMVDIIKLIVSSDVDTKKTIKKMIKRLIAACVVLLVPVIINTAMQLVSSTMDYENCLDNANDVYINKAYIDKADEYVTKATESLSRHDLNLAERYVNKVTDDEIRATLLGRLDDLREYITDIENTTLPDIYTPLSELKDVQNYLSNGSSDYLNDTKCRPYAESANLKSEPDPSFAINYTRKVGYNVQNFAYPKDEKGKSLGAVPTGSNAIRQLTNYKTYMEGLLIFPMTVNYFQDYHGYNHAGADLNANMGTPIYSPVDGYLLNAKWGGTKNKNPNETAYTVQIIMDYPFTYKDKKYEVAYLTHMSGLALRCDSNCSGIRVKKGQLIGYSGTANCSPHLHFSFTNMNAKYWVNSEGMYDIYGLQIGGSKEAGK